HSERDQPGIQDRTRHQIGLGEGATRGGREWQGRVVSHRPKSNVRAGLTSQGRGKGGVPPSRIPTKGAHPLRNSPTGCYPVSRLRAPVSGTDCGISRRTVMNNAGKQAPEKALHESSTSMAYASKTGEDHSGKI